MAVTSMWSIKGRADKVLNYVINPEKTTAENIKILSEYHAIDNVLEYAVDDLKTEKKMYVSGINCDAEYANQQFKHSKDRWEKKGQIVAFHGYQSFKENEVTAELAHEIGKKLAERMWCENFEVVVATHLNTGHYHNHFVLNSVSFNTGKRYLGNLHTYMKMREESDRLCREYGLSVIEETSGKSKNYAEWQAEKIGKLTQRDTIRRDIDAAIKASVTQQQFIRTMEVMGYEFKLWTSTGERLKYPSIKPPGAKGFFRFHKLGEEYDLPRIVQRIRNNNIREEPFPDLYRKKTYTKGKLNGSFKTIKPRGIYALYLRYCYELGIIKKNPTSVKRVSFLLREDIVQMDKYMEQSKVLGKYKIETGQQLLTTKQNLVENISALTEIRKDLRNAQKRATRAGDTKQVESIKAEIATISTQLKVLRREVNALELVEQRSQQVKDNLQELDKQRTIDRLEVKANEHKFGRSRTAR